MASAVPTTRLKNGKAKQPAEPRRVKARSGKVEERFDEASALERFKAVMHKYAGKLQFDGAGE